MLGDRFMADMSQHWLSRQQAPWLKPDNAFWLCATDNPAVCVEKAKSIGITPEQVITLPALSGWDETSWFYSLLMIQVLAFYWAKQLKRPLNPSALSKAVSH
jgi:hypothetical protein